MKQKIAIYADTLTGFGGGSKVIIQLANHLNADIVTAGFNPKVGEWQPIKNKVIDLGNITIKYNKPLGTLFEAPLRYLFMKKPKYDINIFTGSAAIFAASKNNHNIWLCFSPNRVLYDLRDWTFKKSTPFNKILFFFYISLYYWLDQSKARNNFQLIIAQCQTVQKRIAKYYNLTSKIIYSPVDTSLYRFKKFGDFYLAVSRLTPEKRMDLVAKAFLALPKHKLIMVGNGLEQEKISDLIKDADNIQLLANVSDEDLRDLYSNCLATVYMPFEEDFGLVPIESMASGKVCIAANEGGCRETVLHNKTGFLIKATKDEIVKTVKSFNIKKAIQMKSACLKRAKDFDLKKIVGQWQEVVALN